MIKLIITIYTHELLHLVWTYIEYNTEIQILQNYVGIPKNVLNN